MSGPWPDIEHKLPSSEVVRALLLAEERVHPSVLEDLDREFLESLYMAALEHIVRLEKSLEENGLDIPA